jgi:UDP-GlcNAc:undecaprenyl-phosphate/decaprenyl-phosphate GlcNAc-1-phosphate transferase
MIRAGATALTTTLVLVPLIRRLCNRWGLFDKSGPLKIHSGAIPRLGGLAIAISITAGVGLNLPTGSMSIWPFLAALFLIWGAGFIDDIRDVRPILRLAVQIFGGILLWYGGWRLPLLPFGVLNLTCICLFVVLFVNAFNFLDGADGLCAGVTAIVAAGYIVLPGVSLSALGSLVAWSLLGTSVGFLYSNFPPANVFLGDSGSTALGFCVAFLGLDFYRSNVTSLNGATVFFPLLIAAVPLLDAILVLVRRLRDHRAMLGGDRKHGYDFLMARGWSSRRIAVTVYAISAVMCGVGRVALKSEFRIALTLCLTSVMTLLLLGLRLGTLKKNEKTHTTNMIKAG